MRLSPLVLRYHVVSEPPPLLVTAANDRLYEHTCAELFLRGRGPRYEEFNFSPDRRVSHFAFSAYREPEILPSEFAVEVECMANAELVIHARGEFGDRFENARWWPTFVLETREGKSYWAPSHAPGPPDFHRGICSEDGLQLQT